MLIYVKDYADAKFGCVPVALPKTCHYRPRELHYGGKFWVAQPRHPAFFDLRNVWRRWVCYALNISCKYYSMSLFITPHLLWKMARKVLWNSYLPTQALWHAWHAGTEQSMSTQSLQLDGVSLFALPTCKHTKGKNMLENGENGLPNIILKGWRVQFKYMVLAEKICWVPRSRIGDQKKRLERSAKNMRRGSGVRKKYAGMGDRVHKNENVWQRVHEIFSYIPLLRISNRIALNLSFSSFFKH